jgi:hypothetical protein
MVGYQSSFVLDRKEGRIEFSFLWEPQSWLVILWCGVAVWLEHGV